MGCPPDLEQVVGERAGWWIGCRSCWTLSQHWAAPSATDWHTPTVWRRGSAGPSSLLLSDCTTSTAPSRPHCALCNTNTYTYTSLISLCGFIILLLLWWLLLLSLLLLSLILLLLLFKKSIPISHPCIISTFVIFHYYIELSFWHTLFLD